jgi:hypothetical protein
LKVLPQPQRTTVLMYLGWMPFFMIVRPGESRRERKFPRAAEYVSLVSEITSKRVNPK